MAAEFWANLAGAQRKAKELYFNDKGTMRKVKEAWYNDNGTMRKIFSGNLFWYISGKFKPRKQSTSRYTSYAVFPGDFRRDTDDKQGDTVTRLSIVADKYYKGGGTEFIVNIGFLGGPDGYPGNSALGQAAADEWKKGTFVLELIGSDADVSIPYVGGNWKTISNSFGAPYNGPFFESKSTSASKGIAQEIYEVINSNYKDGNSDQVLRTYKKK